MSQRVLLEEDVDRTYHRPGWFDPDGAIGEALLVDRRTARMVAGTPCRHCFPECY